jgi:hypothetical protein
MRFPALALAIAAPACCAVLLVTTASRAHQPAPRKPAPVAKSGPTILGHVQLRDRRITMKAGGLYSVRMGDGRIVADNVTLAELRTADPNSHQRMTDLIAARDAGVAWAGR